MNLSPVVRWLTVYDRTYPVRQTEIDGCERFVNEATKEVIYLVTDYRHQVYVVRFIKAMKRIRCTCPDGMAATCRHRRAVTLAEMDFHRNQR